MASTRTQDLERRVADCIRNLHNRQADLGKVQDELNKLRAQEAQLINIVDQEQRNVDDAIDLLQSERRTA